MAFTQCACDDSAGSVTLAQLRQRIITRLGMAAMPAGLPGMTDLINDFLQSAQESLYRRYSVLHNERWFTWSLVAGQRFYDLPGNDDQIGPNPCNKALDPRGIKWVGVSQDEDNWRPLIHGIAPTTYTSKTEAIPTHYAIRACIEVWPAPSDATWKLRVLGKFGLGSFTADTDVASVDPEAIFLMALANAKAHYGQPDGGNYMQQLQVYIGDVVAGSHQTARYFPGRIEYLNAVPPVIV